MNESKRASERVGFGILYILLQDSFVILVFIFLVCLVTAYAEFSFPLLFLVGCSVCLVA